MEHLYFAFYEDADIGDVSVIITPKKMWDEERRWCDQGTEAAAALRKHGIPLCEATESVFEFTEPHDLDEMRALLVSHGAEENLDLVA